MKHLEDFQSIPEIFRDAVFEQAFEKAALANMNPAELESYERNLKVYRDLKNVVDTAYDDGKLDGKLEGKLETAIQLKILGIAVDIISKSTGLSEEEISSL